MHHPFIARALVCLAALGLFASESKAECTGHNLIAALPAADQASLRAQAATVPFATGNLWRATRGDDVAYIVGTYHLDDPRHAATLAALAPVLASATSLLVEAGPDEEAALLARLKREPGLVFDADGPSLPESLPSADWQLLSDAMRARGIPPFTMAKLRPWYLSIILGIPACAMPDLAAANGLDKRLMAEARGRGLAIRALEPYDTILTVFQAMPQGDQQSMIRATLAMEARSEDMMATLAASYFSGESRLMWEFTRRETARLPGYTPARADAELGLIEGALLNGRNRAWIPVIEAAAKDGPVLVAFGALHLSGTSGVLALLEARGFIMTALPQP